MVRKLVVTVCIMAMCSVANAVDWVVYGQGANTSSDTFQDSWGGGVQARFPTGLMDGLQVGASAGYSVTGIEKWSYESCLADLRIDGSITDVPIGLTLLYGFKPMDRLTVGFEGGLQYHLLNSNAGLHVDRILWIHPGLVDQLDVDNQWTASIGANLEYAFTPRVSVLVGCGYTFALEDEKFRLSGFELPLDADLSGMFGRVGVVVKTP